MELFDFGDFSVDCVNFSDFFRLFFTLGMPSDRVAALRRSLHGVSRHQAECGIMNGVYAMNRIFLYSLVLGGVCCLCFAYASSHVSLGTDYAEPVAEGVSLEDRSAPLLGGVASRAPSASQPESGPSSSYQGLDLENFLIADSDLQGFFMESQASLADQLLSRRAYSSGQGSSDSGQTSFFQSSGSSGDSGGGSRGGRGYFSSSSGGSFSSSGGYGGGGSGGSGGFGGGGSGGTGGSGSPLAYYPPFVTPASQDDGPNTPQSDPPKSYPPTISEDHPIRWPQNPDSGPNADQTPLLPIVADAIIPSLQDDSGPDTPAATPEPGTLILGGMGLIGLAAARRRKRQAQ